MAKIFDFKAIVITTTVLLVAAITMSATYPVQAKVEPTPPNTDGSCASGSFETRIGCCPNGTTNIHDTCVVSSSPKPFVGISVGVGALLLFIGMSIGPVLTGVYMENHQTIKGVQGSYPSLESYNLVFLTSGLLSTVSVRVFVLFIIFVIKHYNHSIYLGTNCSE
jgi:hypothetical protein